MIPFTHLEKPNIKTTRLGFGTSRLHHVGHSIRQSLLSAAVELGFRHFDTAPSYGGTLAETELGQFLQHRREGVVIFTKFGLSAPSMFSTLPPLNAALRRIRWLIHRQKTRPLDSGEMVRSVEDSLRRLKIDRLDALLIHEPTLERISDENALLESLHMLRDKGYIRAWGVAGSWKNIGPVISKFPQLAPIVQTDEYEWPANTPPDISYGVLRSRTRPFVSSSENVDLLINSALQRRSQGVVLISTTKIDHLNAIARSVNAS